MRTNYNAHTTTARDFVQQLFGSTVRCTRTQRESPVQRAIHKCPRTVRASRDDTERIQRALDQAVGTVPDLASMHSGFGVAARRVLRALDLDVSSPGPHEAEELRRTALDALAEGCCICMDPFVAGERMVVLRACKHRYHRACIHKWAQDQFEQKRHENMSRRGDALASGPECPMCRVSLL